MEAKDAQNIELGDWISIHTLEGPVTGDVIFRNDKIIRLKPKQVRTTAIDYLLDENGDFREEDGVVFLVQIHMNSEYFHCAAMLGVQPGEKVEFFTKNGTAITEIEGKQLIDPETGTSIAIVENLIMTDTDDALLLTNGLLIPFSFIGPQDPIAIIVASAPAFEGEGGEGTETIQEEELVEEITLEELMREIMPSSIIEEIPQSERFYPDAVQRQEMYNDFLTELTPDKQKNIKSLRELSQKVEYILALKQSTVRLNKANRPIGEQKSTFEHLSDVVSEVRSSYIPACVPIYDVKKSIYTDIREPNKSPDLESHMLLDVEFAAQKRADLYENGEYVTDGLTFYNYMDTIFSSDLHPYYPKSGINRESIVYEQEAYIAPPPGEMRVGFSSDLPVGYLNTNRQKKGALFTPLSNEFLSTVPSRVGRFLPGVRAVSHKGIPATTVAVPSDQVTTHGYVILDTPTILNIRTIHNVPSIMTRILIANYQRENRDFNFFTDLLPVSVSEATAESEALYLTKEQVSQATPEFWNIWIRNNLYRTLSPIHAFSPASTYLAIMMDAFVPIRSDFPQSLQNEVWKFISRNMTMWKKANASTRQRILKKLGSEAGGAEGTTFPTLIESAIPMNERVTKDVLLGILVKTIKEKETTLRNNPFVLINEFTKGFNGEAFIQYANIMAVLENREPAFDTEWQKSKLEEIIRAQQNKNQIALARKNAFKAKPEINSCPHVRFLIAVKKAKSRDRIRFIELFQEFLSKYQGVRNGNWISCRECNKDAVCVHEIMILNEALHPGRSMTLRKKLLIEFGGPVFEGHFSCRNCGEPIQGISFDTNMEFDDEGRPISGRTIINNDDGPKEIDITEIVTAKTPMKFAKEEEQKLYMITKLISERAGASLDDEIYKRIIYRAGIYLDKKVPTEAVYNAEVARLKAQSTRKRMSSYTEYTRNQQIAVIAALFLFELQTSDPAVEIRHPFFPPCPFSISGFPTEGLNPEEVGTGGVSYVACCTASIRRESDPWMFSSWYTEQRQETATNTVRTLMISVFNSLIGTARSGTQLPISSEIRDIMKGRVERLQAYQRKELPSAQDRLPTGFQPEPFIQLPTGVRDTPTSGDPNPVIQSMDLQSIDIPARDMNYRLRVIYATLKQQANERAKREGLLFVASERSTSFASPTTLQDIKRGILTVLGIVPLEEEANRLSSALRTIELRSPSSTNAGTHIWTPFSIRQEKEARTEIPKNILYKLFLNTCFRGPNIGSPHKLGYGNICKNCSFQFPASPDIVNPEKEGKPALEAQGIDYSETEFDKILAAKREKQSIQFTVKPDDPELIQNIAEWIADPILGPADAKMWSSVSEILTGIGKGIDRSSDIERDTAWGPFVTVYDQARERLRTVIGTSATRKTRAEAVATQFMASFDVLTQFPLGNGTDTIINALISPLIQRASSYKVSSATSLREVKGRYNVDEIVDAISKTQWMKLSTEHVSLLDEILREHTKIITDCSKQAKEVCKRVGLELGSWFQRWKELIFEEPSQGFTEKEAQYILRFTLIRTLLEVIDVTSDYYKNMPTNGPEEGPLPEKTSVMREMIEFLAECITRYASKARIPSENEIREMLLKRAEAERNYIIGIFEKLDEDEEAVEKVLKKFGIGKWAMGKNVKDYSPELYEHDRNQRIEMGMFEMAPAPAPEGRITGADFGFMSFAGESRADRGYENNDHEGREYGEQELRGGDI